MKTSRLLAASGALALLLLAAFVVLWSRDGPRPFRGHMMLTTEPWTFTPCDSATGRRVLDATGGRLGEIVKRFVPPEEPVYAEVLARRLPSSRLAISDIRYAARETHGCRDNLRRVILRALGNEPFWAVTITAREIRFEAPDDPGRVAFPAVEPSRSGNRLVYHTRNDRGDRLDVTVREQACSDGMSDAYYATAVEVQINDREFSGCGRPGWTE
ncbi:MAG TPA: hypothetical protein VFT63_05445 [bacterium]|nr:hypothetical protein [bacterium]